MVKNTTFFGEGMGGSQTKKVQSQAEAKRKKTPHQMEKRREAAKKRGSFSRGRPEKVFFKQGFGKKEKNHFFTSHGHALRESADSWT